jgi:hypothetical protein
MTLKSTHIRFDAMGAAEAKLGRRVQQVSVWGMRDGPNANNCYQYIWPHLEKWLAEGSSSASINFGALKSDDIDRKAPVSKHNRTIT